MTYVKERNITGEKSETQVYGSLLCHVFPFTSSALLPISLYNFSYKRDDSMMSAVAKLGAHSREFRSPRLTLDSGTLESARIRSLLSILNLARASIIPIASLYQYT